MDDALRVPTDPRDEFVSSARDDHFFERETTHSSTTRNMRAHSFEASQRSGARAARAAEDAARLEERRRRAYVEPRAFGVRERFSLSRVRVDFVRTGRRESDLESRALCLSLSLVSAVRVFWPLSFAISRGHNLSRGRKARERERDPFGARSCAQARAVDARGDRGARWDRLRRPHSHGRTIKTKKPSFFFALSQHARAWFLFENARPLLQADGVVLNVWRGRHFYAQGGPYASMAGVDATRQLAMNRLDGDEDYAPDVQTSVPRERARTQRITRQKDPL